MTEPPLNRVGFTKVGGTTCPNEEVARASAAQKIATATTGEKKRVDIEIPPELFASKYFDLPWLAHISYRNCTLVGERLVGNRAILWPRYRPQTRDTSGQLGP